MIVEFTIKNFRSFKDEFTLSLEAENLPSNKAKLIETSGGIPLLPSVGIFGANASGKSNVFKALSFMLSAMKNTDINKPTVEHNLLLPFELDDFSAGQPTFMQIVLWDPDVEREYRYGFRISRTEVLEEWLYLRSKPKEKFTNKCVFKRRGDKFDADTEHVPSLKDLPPKVNPKILALPIFAQFYHRIALDLFNFTAKITILDSNAINMDALTQAIDFAYHDPSLKSEVAGFIRKADTGIQDLKLIKREIPLSDSPAKVRAHFQKQGFASSQTTVNYQALIRHKTYGEKPGSKDFSLYNHESSGTAKIFVLATSLLKALKTGGVFFIDELDAGLHPLLAQAIISQIDSRNTNPRGVQLIYSSHATHLLSRTANPRRDQVWFAEKNNREESALKCLSGYKTRNDYEIARNYLVGRFGAVPILDFVESEMQVD